ncbi:MAG TPA: 2-oxoacid:acceptor oxidoreductase family protein [Candidatus Binataceae bacterium]|jgi:pyruvate ferredoxin oxidoreductase gamma subunit|nr:2-oxoacid:acceptor oxidoreductase family protein [Candidatus Binataceae bacterium]
MLLKMNVVTALTEIRIDGRGGQGNVIAAYILAEAGFEAGRHVQAFPSFGPERRGAPVAAYVRISDRPFKRRCQILEPNYVIIQDPSLLHLPRIVGVRPEGGTLINSPKDLEELGFAPQSRTAVIPATALAVEILGLPIPNSALLGAFLMLTDLLPMDALEKALARRFEGETLQRNLQLMAAAAKRVTPGLWKEAVHAARN